MPVLSCGLMRSMHSWQDQPLATIPDRSQDELVRVIETAFDCGITHFETARGYGSSERQLGEILTRYERDSFILQTKVRPDDDSARFTVNVEDSLARLNTQRVNLLTLHGINDYHSLWQACRPGGCLCAARKLQQQGRVDWVGFSGHGETRVIVEAINHGEDGGFDFVNIHWYAIWQQNTPALEAAAAHDMGVFIISPTDKGGMLQTPSEKISALSRPLSPLQFNDLFCLQRPEVHTLSVGAAHPDDFRAHLDILADISDKELVDNVYLKWQQAMQESCRVDRPDAHWQKLPCWDKIPGYMNISFTLWLYNLARGWGLVEYARQRYRKLGVDMPWVRGNNCTCAKDYDLSKVARSIGMSGEKLAVILAQAHDLLH